MPTFDGDTLIITLDAPVAGVLNMDAEADLYSEWKDWQLAGNMRFPQAFETTGGDPLTPGVDAGAYFFLRNDLGWRVRPDESDHTVYLNGNFVPKDSALPIMIPTIGAYTVLVDGLQPITQNIDTIKTSLEFTTFNGGIHWDNVAGKSSITDADIDGNEANPLLNLSDVITQAVAIGFTKIYVVSATATVPSTPSLDNYQLVGKNRSQTLVTFSSADTGDISVKKMRITGSMNGAMHAENCTIGGVAGVGCTTNPTTMLDCDFDGDVTLRADNTQPINIINCGSIDNNLMTLDINGTIGNIALQNYADRLAISNMTTAINIHISSSAGCEFTVNASCTAVTLFEVHGNVNIINNSALTIDDDTTQSLVWQHPLANNLFHLIESQRGHHTATGNTFYWDPFNGDDANDGLTDVTAKATWGGASGVNSLVVANNHDLVIILPGDTTGPTTITEQIVVDKEYTFLRGPGRDLLFKPTATTNETISVSAEGVELSGMRIETAATGDGEALIISGDFSNVHDVWVEESQGDGIRLQNVSYSILKDIVVRNCAQDGVVFRGTSQDCVRNILSNAIIQGNTRDGIRIDGSLAVDNYIWGGENGVAIDGNSGYGINEVNSANDNHVIGPVIHVKENTLGNINLTGATSVSENTEQWAAWDKVIEGTFTAEEIMRIMAGALAGKASKSGNDRTYRDLSDTKDRIVATVTPTGDRTAVTLDKT